MNMLPPNIALLSLLLIASCRREHEKSRELIEANRLHLEAIKIAHQLEKKLKKLPTQRDSPTTRVRVDSLQNLIELWESNVIEVPGFPHAHNHAHGAGEPKIAPPMTDESMLDYQQKSLEAIRALQIEVETFRIADRP